MIPLSMRLSGSGPRDTFCEVVVSHTGEKVTLRRWSQVREWMIEEQKLYNRSTEIPESYFENHEKIIKVIFAETFQNEEILIDYLTCMTHYIKSYKNGMQELMKSIIKTQNIEVEEKAEALAILFHNYNCFTLENIKFFFKEQVEVIEKRSLLLLEVLHEKKLLKIEILFKYIGIFSGEWAQVWLLARELFTKGGEEVPKQEIIKASIEGLMRIKDQDMKKDWIILGNILQWAGKVITNKNRNYYKLRDKLLELSKSEDSFWKAEAIVILCNMVTHGGNIELEGEVKTLLVEGLRRKEAYREVIPEWKEVIKYLIKTWEKDLRRGKIEEKGKHLMIIEDYRG